MAQSGNGIDITAVYNLLMQMSARLDSHDRKLDQLLAIINEHTRTLSDHTRQLDDLNAGVTGLRSDVGLYQEAVAAQGIHYSGLEDRMRRVERHLKLEPSPK